MKKHLGIFLLLVFWGCSTPAEEYWHIGGPAMGTQYNITCSNGNQFELQKNVGELLDAFNLSLSTYITESNISQFNESDSLFRIHLQSDPYFLPVLELSKKLFKQTNGAFDPSILPLLEYYGFGSRKNHEATKSEVNLDSIMNLVGFNKIKWTLKNDTLILRKKFPGIKLNFNSIAKGYGVDLVAELLDKNGVKNYLVEIGGEVRSKGLSPRKTKWRLGINTPTPNSGVHDYLLTMDITDASMATSGNYRDFYTKNGKKYVHITDPRSGANKESSLASATIVTKDCATSDALATACIVLGLQESMTLINGMDGVEACLIEIEGTEFKIHFTEHFNQYLNE
jgi:thiamine biosynthesis lipoprotein